MPILEKFTKEPGDTQDYDISFVDYLAFHGDTGANHTVEADPGITIVSSSLVNGIVKVWVSGGLDGKAYRVTATLTTSSVPARVRVADIQIKVKN